MLIRNGATNTRYNYIGVQPYPGLGVLCNFNHRPGAPIYIVSAPGLASSKKAQPSKGAGPQGQLISPLNIKLVDHMRVIC